MEHMSINAITESITCPITGDIMNDPVQGNDGQTYERSAIIQALNIKQESPITRQYMTINDLKVNASIRFLCDKYHSGAFGSITIDRRQPKISVDSIKLDNTICKFNNKLLMTFNVNDESFPKNLEFGHLSQDIVLIIDHSGSMRTAVEAKDANGNNMENGMSIQDIVNHSAKTVVKTLDSNSRISIIKFDNTIELVNDLMLASEMNKTQILSKINTIKPDGQTNIWSAIEKGIQILDNREDKTRNSAILMLTDGSPNISPARGEVETLKRLRKNKNFTTPIYTFGFGYNLKRELLYDMAKYANGGNGHIPDGNMIATVFCNFIGTILTTVVLNLQLHVVPKENNSGYFTNLLMGDYAMNFDPITQEYIYDIGTVQYQQERNIVFNVEEKLDFDYYYSYKIGGQSYKSETKTVDNHFMNSCIEDNKVNIHNYRYDVIESIRKMINYNRILEYDSSLEIYNQLVTILEENICPKTKAYVDNLLKNIKGNNGNEGQVKMAINKNYFGRWGEFYLDQLSRSLNQQIKPNFKDEACLFGGEVFETVVDKASDIFDTLEPPTPSLLTNNYTNYGNYSSLGQSPTPSAPIVMSYYNDAGGGCMHSDCLITMANGSKTALKNIKRGDKIMSLSENNIQTSAYVICVVETKINSKIREMIELPGGLKITPWHPVKYSVYSMENNKLINNWMFPSTINNTTLVCVDSIITLVLDEHHVAIVNDVPCITLAHNFTNGVLDHPYYGTNKVLYDLQMHYGWNYGHIILKDNEISYVKEKNKVSKMIFSNVTNIVNNMNNMNNMSNMNKQQYLLGY